MNNADNIGNEPPRAPVDVDTIAREVQERFNRSRNVIIFNLEESQNIAADRDRIIGLFNTLNINTNNIEIRRIGRVIRDRPRAVVVTLNSRTDVINVLRNRRQMPQHISVKWNNTKPLSFSKLGYIPRNILKSTTTLADTASLLRLSQLYPEHPHKNYTLDLCLGDESFASISEFGNHLALVPPDSHHIPIVKKSTFPEWYDK